MISSAHSRRRVAARARLAILAWSAAFPATSAAAADPLERAKALFAEQAYDQALVALGQARAQADGHTAQAETWLWEGFVLVGLERSDEARTAFRRALRLDPGVDLPPRTSPKIAAVFEEAAAAERARRERRRSAAAAPPRASPPEVAERAFAVTTRVAQPFFGLDVRLRIERGKQLVSVLPMRDEGHGAYVALVPADFAAAGARLELRVELADGDEVFSRSPDAGAAPVVLVLPGHRAALRLRSPLRGARIVVAGREVGRVPHEALIPVAPGSVAITLEAPDGTVREQVRVVAGQIRDVFVTRGPGVPLRTVTRWALAGTGLVATVVGAVFTALARDAERDVELAAQRRGDGGLPETTYGAVEATDQRGRAFDVAGIVCLAAGGAALAASLALWLWPHGEPRARAPRLGLRPGALQVAF